MAALDYEDVKAVSASATKGQGDEETMDQKVKRIILARIHDRQQSKTRVSLTPGTIQ